VRELAHHVASLAPLTLQATKEATRRVSQALALKDAEDLLMSCYLSHDFQEGVRAFLDKRPARFEGR
jgi:enoyl-CoA hydratase/carnithine racemase